MPPWATAACSSSTKDVAQAVLNALTTRAGGETITDSRF